MTKYKTFSKNSGSATVYRPALCVRPVQRWGCTSPPGVKRNVDTITLIECPSLNVREAMPVGAGWREWCPSDGLPSTCVHQASSIKPRLWCWQLSLLLHTSASHIVASHLWPHRVHYNEAVDMGHTAHALFSWKLIPHVFFVIKGVDGYTTALST
jgi:hypothetical protein